MFLLTNTNDIQFDGSKMSRNSSDFPDYDQTRGASGITISKNHFILHTCLKIFMAWFYNYKCGDATTARNVIQLQYR